MPLLEKINNRDGQLVGYLVDCPGCKNSHLVYMTGKVKWSFNGNMDKPTFSPSLLVNGDLSNPSSPRCHSFIRNGVWEFLPDCTHELAGKKVKMIEVE